MKQRRAIISSLLIPILTVCFYNTGEAGNPPAILINEIAWMGTGSKTTNEEWIELRNTANEEIDLAGWTLVAEDGVPSINLNGKVAAGGFFLMERVVNKKPREIFQEISADFFYEGALEDGGEKLLLKDKNGNMEEVNASAKWPTGETVTRKTMERKSDGSWQTSLNPGGTPRADNSAGEAEAGEPPEEDEEEIEQPEDGASDENGAPDDAASGDPENNSENAADGSLGAARLGDILINELVSDPADNDVEWVEIYNTVSREWDLTGWTLEDGSGAKTVLTGKISGSGAEKYLVIEKPKGNLNNKGDLIILRDAKGNLIDQVVYGDWDDGSPENNAPAASDPNSSARIMDGYNTFSNKNDFRVTRKITPGFGNVIEAEGADDFDSQSGNCADIMFTEVSPNPAGEDGENEFIELWNSGKKEIDLTGWKITDESGKQYVFRAKTAGAGNAGPATENIIKPGEYRAVYRTESKLALNNTNDSLALFEPEKEKACKSLNYEKAAESFSFSYDFSEKRWVWSEIATPGAENKIKKPATPPDADFTAPEKIIVGAPARFDSSDTVDEDGDALKYFWDFGDGIKNRLPNPEHTYLKAGNFVVKLSVSDSRATGTKEKIIKALAAGESFDGGNGEINDESDEQGITLSADQSNLTGLRINEIFPDPAGSDQDGEFIEFWNSGGIRINAINWILRDGSASGKYRFKDDLWLEPDEMFLVKREISGLTLNNDTDKVRLFNALDELAEEVEYAGALEGASYAKGENGKWFWTTKVTPGKNNIIAAAEVALKNNDAKSGIVNGVKVVAAADDSQFQALELSKVHETEKGEKILTRGIVAVLPGVFGSQYFYIVSGASLNPSGSFAPEGGGAVGAVGGESDAQKNCGIQVYNYKKEFPDLKIGDVVEVRGEITESAGEKRIKTSGSEDMKNIQAGNPPEPMLITGNGIEETVSGGLVKIAGQVTERKGYQFYIDDGEAEAVGYIKKSTGITTAEITEGDEIELTGILIRNDSGARIFPRSPDDLVKVKKAAALAGDESGNNAEVEIAGELPPADEWAIAGRDRKLQMFKYFLIIAGAAIIGLLIWLGKLLREKD
ncbi:MAG: lamin tail domain-containing protein [Patescibacteria group bacterium]|jgi:PKD repeat protein